MSCPTNRFGPSCPPKASNADLAKEMERRLAELQAARTTQETKLGIGASVFKPAAPVALTESTVSKKLTSEEWEKQVAELMSGREAAAPVIPKEDIDTTGIFGQKSRETEPVMNLAERMASLAAARGTQDTDFANMVPMEIEANPAPTGAALGKSSLAGASI